MQNPGTSVKDLRGLVNKNEIDKSSFFWSGMGGESAGEACEEKAVPLDLFNNRNNSNFLDSKFEECSRIYVKLLDAEREYVRTILLPCNQWRCPECKPRKLRKLRSDLSEALEGAVEELQKKGGSTVYGVKLLTLTVPGAEYRASKTILEAHLEIKKNWNKLRTMLKKRLGKFEYIAMVEAQRDGYPHIHAILVGRAIVTSKVLGIIRDAWSKKYKMGNIDLQRNRGIRHLINYVTKYITKSVLVMPDGMRMYSMSSGMQKIKNERAVMKKNKKRYQVMEVGTWSYDHVRGGKIFKPFYIPEGANSILEIADENVMNELLEWFEDKARGRMEQQGIF